MTNFGLFSGDDDLGGTVAKRLGSARPAGPTNGRF